MEMWSIMRGSGGSAGFHQLVDDRIHQGLERGVDDVGGYAHGGPALAGFILALDQHAGNRFGSGIENANPIVGEVETLDVLLIFSEILAQGEIERVDGAVALGRREQRLAP